MNAYRFVVALALAAAALNGVGAPAPAVAAESYVARVKLPEGARVQGVYGFKEGRAVVGLETPQGPLYGAINRYGYFVAPLRSGHMSRYSDGLLRVEGRLGRDPVVFLDRFGRPVLELTYAYVGEFHDGVAVFTPGAPIQEWVRFGLVDKTGKVVVPAKYDLIWPFFKDGVAAVKLGNKFGAINPRGEVVVPIEYDWLRTAGDGLLHVKQGERAWFMEIATGKPAFAKDYGGGFFKDGHAVVTRADGSKKDVILDRQGREYEPAGPSPYQFSEGLVAYGDNDKYGLLRGDGSVMVPARFDNVPYYEDGMCNVQVDGKWGYLDKQGRMAIPARFDQAARFSEGLAAVVENGHAYYIDRQGRVAVDVGETARHCWGGF